MKIVETTILESSIRIRLADHPDHELATHWIELEVPIAGLELPSKPHDLGDPETRLLAEVRLAALRHARDAIGAETQRLASLVDQKR